MRKYLLFFCFVLMGCTQALAQQEEELPEQKGFDKSKLFVGGNFGISFGDYTLANISPQLGYRFNRFVAAGVGVNFQYSGLKYRNSNGDPSYKASYGVTGLNVFGRVYPIEYILLQVQPEINYTWGKYKFYNGQPDEKVNGKLVPSLLLGAGAVIPSGPGALVIMVQYDILNNPRSPYGNRPIYNVGYNVGL
ncbi:MAG: hypothetical protein WKF89_09465 [Chitinophagaceae bacterium]